MDSSCRDVLINDVIATVQEFKNAMCYESNDGLKYEEKIKRVLEARMIVLEKILRLNEFYVKSLEANASPVKIDYKIEQELNKALQVVQDCIPFDGFK